MTKDLIAIVGLNTDYKIYIPYYIIFLYYSNPNAHLLIITDNSHVTNYDESLEYAINVYGKNKIKILVDPPYLNNIKETNLIKKYLIARSTIPYQYYEDYDYLYIGDVDLFIGEKDLFQNKIEILKKMNTTVVNFIRYVPNQKHGRVSGLHFIDIKSYLNKYRHKLSFKQDDLTKIFADLEFGMKIYDEHVWYHILDEDDITKLLSHQKSNVQRMSLIVHPGPHMGIYRVLTPDKYENATDILEYTKKYCTGIDSFLRGSMTINTEEFRMIHNKLNDHKVNIYISMVDSIPK